jgi:hypothetical protein
MSHQDNMNTLLEAAQAGPSTAVYQLVRQELMPKMERELQAREELNSHPAEADVVDPLLRSEKVNNLLRELGEPVYKPASNSARLVELRRQLVELHSDPTRFNEILPAQVIVQLLAK